MRLFVGLDLPEALRERLAALYGSLAGARWSPPANLHLTLRFIGEVRPDVAPAGGQPQGARRARPVELAPRAGADEVDHALSAIRARRFDLALSGVGIFDRGGRRSGVPRTLWAGGEGREPLEHLRGKIETALQRIGLPAERKRFQPHVTLARVDAIEAPVLASWVQAHNLLRSPGVPLAHFTLFSSLLGKEHPFYTAEVEYELV